MSTYEEYLQLLALLPANIQAIIRQLWEGGHNLSPRELLRLIYFLFAGANLEQIQRILVLLARLGRLSPGVLQEALALHAAGEGASVAAGGAAAGGATAGGAAAGGATAGGATAGGVTAGGATVGGAAVGEGGALAGATAGTALFATIAAILAALLAIALAAYTISSEVLTQIKFPGSGLRCQGGAGGGSTVWHIWRRAIGSRSAVQKAIDAAQKACERGGGCSGECASGSCKPVASFIRLDPRYRVLWTTAHAYYICSCECVSEE